MELQDLILLLTSSISFFGVVSSIFSYSWIKKLLRVLNLLIHAIELYKDKELKKVIEKHFTQEDLKSLNYLDKLLKRTGFKK